MQRRLMNAGALGFGVFVLSSLILELLPLSAFGLAMFILAIISFCGSVACAIAMIVNYISGEKDKPQ